MKQLLSISLVFAFLLCICACNHLPNEESQTANIATKLVLTSTQINSSLSFENATTTTEPIATTTDKIATTTTTSKPTTTTTSKPVTTTTTSKSETTQLPAENTMVIDVANKNFKRYWVKSPECCYVYSLNFGTLRKGELSISCGEGIEINLYLNWMTNEEKEEFIKQNKDLLFTHQGKEYVISSGGPSFYDIISISPGLVTFSWEDAGNSSPTVKNGILEYNSNVHEQTITVTKITNLDSSAISVGDVFSYIPENK